MSESSKSKNKTHRSGSSIVVFHRIDSKTGLTHTSRLPWIMDTTNLKKSFLSEVTKNSSF